MRTVIWDLGGTLVDTYPDVDRALAGALSPAPGEELLHEVALLTRRSSGEAIRTLAARHHVSEELLQDAYERTKEVWEEHPPPVMDGARELLEAVREAGGLNLVATHRHRDSASALLERLALEVDDLVCAPDGFARKPSPQMLRTLLARHDLAPRDCLAVGDRTADVEAAAAAGVPAQLLETPGVPLDAAGADRLRSLRALIALFPAPGAQGRGGH